MLPLALALFPRAARCLGALLVFTLLVVACERPPTDLEESAGLRPDQSLAQHNALDPLAVCGDGKKTIEVTVYVDPEPNGAEDEPVDPVPAPGVLVAGYDAVDPTDEPPDSDGLLCAAMTGPDGVAEMVGYAGQQLTFVVRDNATRAWVLEAFIPPEFPATQAGLQAFDSDYYPSWPSVPVVLSQGPGEASCTQKNFAPEVWKEGLKSGCTVPSSGLKVDVLFDDDNNELAAVINPSLCFLTGCTGAENALIAALTEVPCKTQADRDDYFPWLDECGNVKSGGVIQAGDVYSSSFGGLSVRSHETTYIEVVASVDGETVVGSLDFCFDPSEGDTCVNSTDINTYPGICYAVGQPVKDTEQPAGSALLDMIEVWYGWGFDVTTPDGPRSSFLEPEPDEAVVVLRAVLTEDLPAGGKFTLRYTLFGTSATRKIEVDYGVLPNGDCYVGGARGNGLTGGISVRENTCRREGDTPAPVAYEFMFIAENIPATLEEQATASFTLTSDGDTWDPDLSHNDGFVGGYTVFDYLTPDSDPPTLTEELECFWNAKNVESKWRPF